MKSIKMPTIDKFLEVMNYSQEKEFDEVLGRVKFRSIASTTSKKQPMSTKNCFIKDDPFLNLKGVLKNHRSYVKKQVSFDLPMV